MAGAFLYSSLGAISADIACALLPVARREGAPEAFLVVDQ